MIQAATIQAHSALAPGGPQARAIDRLWEGMYWISVVVFVLVVSALLYGALRRRSATEVEGDGAHSRMRAAVIIATGLIIAILFVFLVLDISTGNAVIVDRTTADAVNIQVTGYQWWWEVQYPDSIPQNQVTTANEIHVPLNRPITVELRSEDVIHSFWPPNLMGKRDLIPGKKRWITFQVDHPGTYRGQCAEYCGHQHAKMAFLVLAQPADSFAAWLASQRDTAVTPTDSLAVRGRDVFVSGPCAMCHAIEGTPAGSRVGPDLTHLMSRRTIAAGTLPNTRAARAAWVSDPQAIKPGNRMPPTDLKPADLQAVLAYLETLK